MDQSQRELLLHHPKFIFKSRKSGFLLRLLQVSQQIKLFCPVDSECITKIIRDLFEHDASGEPKIFQLTLSA